MPIVDIVGQTYELDERNLSGQRTINWHVEEYQTEDTGTKTATALKPIPGGMLERVMSDVTSDICRGLFVSSSGPAPYFTSRLYGVWGITVYRFNDLLAPFVLGNVSSNMEPCVMADNGLDFAIVDGVKTYSYPLAAVDGVGALAEVAMPLGGGLAPETIKPTHIAFYKQRFIVNNRNSNQWYYSKLGLTEFDTVNNFDFYSAESNSDLITGLRVCGGSLWIFGNNSYEIWREGPSAADPFAVVGGSSSQIGLLGTKTIATVNEMIFWFGASDVGHGMVYMGTSTSAQRVSNMGIEDQIKKLTNPTDSIGWCYAEGGNIFYILSFPTDNRTWVYDQSLNKWHERLRFEPLTGVYKVYPYVYGVYLNQKTYCGTLNGAALTYLKDGKCTEWNGDAIVRKRISPVWNASMMAFSIREFSIDGQVGTTDLLQGQGSDPKIIVEISRDGGYTYGTRRDLSIGKQGHYRKLVRLFTLGRATELVVSISISDPVPYTIYQARLDYDLCGRS